MSNLRNGSKGGFEPGLTRLRVRHSTTELPRSTNVEVSTSRFSTNRNQNILRVYCNCIQNDNLNYVDYNYRSHSGIYGFRGNRKIPFLKITMALPRLIAPAKRLLEQGFQFEGYPMHGYQSYESNIDFEIRSVLSFEAMANGEHFIWKQR